MKHLRITDNCLVKGEHTEVGTELTVEDSLAGDLLASGRAVIIEELTPKPSKKGKEPAE